MRYTLSLTCGALLLVACGGAQPTSTSPGSPTDAETYPQGTTSPESESDSPTKAEGSENEFQLGDSDSAADAHGASVSKIKPSATEAAMKFFVVDQEKGPIPGIVISLTSPDGKSYYTGESDAKGYAEVLVPVGAKYDLVYLSLGRRDISAKVPVPDEPNQNIKLTLRYKNNTPPKAPGQTAEAGFILKGITFDTGKATIRPESLSRLDSVLEYLTHKQSARIQISGHTDNVGDPARNQKLSEQRAQACRQHLVSKGIEASRVEAVGYGDSQPIAPNDTEEGRQRNRRIEAIEL